MIAPIDLLREKPFLFYFILFYFILFYFILFYFILFYFILFYFKGLFAWNGKIREIGGMTVFVRSTTC